MPKIGFTYRDKLLDVINFEIPSRVRKSEFSIISKSFNNQNILRPEEAKIIITKRSQVEYLIFTEQSIQFPNPSIIVTKNILAKLFK